MKRVLFTTFGQERVMSSRYDAFYLTKEGFTYTMQESIAMY